MTKHSVGFVYVLRNENYKDGLVKIGLSSKLAEDRAKEGYTTFVPGPFDVLFRAATSHPVELERAVHDLLAPHRNRSDREFFWVSPEFAAESILKMRAEVDGIATWSAHRRVLLQSGDQLLLSMRADQIFALLAYPTMFASSAKIVDLRQSHADGDTLEIYATGNPSYVAGLSDGDPGAEEDPVPFLNRTGIAANVAINGRERLVPGDRLLWMDASTGDGACTSVMFEAKDYCQVVSRSPRSSPEGFPLLLNDSTVPEITPTIERAVQQALRLPMPRSWAPRRPDESDGWAAVGGAVAPPTHWLPQLANSRPRKKKRSSGKEVGPGTS